MNPVTNTPPPPPPPPLQPPQSPSSSSCPQHPDDTFHGFCPSCLLERLSFVDQSSINLNKHDEVRAFKREDITNMSDLENDILEMEAKIDTIVHNLKSINDHIHLDDAPSTKSNFWSTSVWTKKWQKWRHKHKHQQKQKQKNKDGVDKNGVVLSSKLPDCHDTHSEIADYGFGRRSCDTGPRFSLDAGRVSVDMVKGSWDGYLVGRSYPKLEDGKIQQVAEVNIPGGSIQTREYYLNCSSRRRKGGLERSNSMVVDNPNTGLTNAKASPGYVGPRRLKFHSIGGEKDLGLVKKPGWWNWKVKVWGNQISKTGEFDRKLSRSNSSVSWRNVVETGDNNCERDEFVSEKDSNHRASNGLLRFYLTPLRGSQRSGTGTGTSKCKVSSSKG
ncbi:putative protein OCTOPUS [Helianthus debilis subsp. tardiflorus]